MTRLQSFRKDRRNKLRIGEIRMTQYKIKKLIQTNYNETLRLKEMGDKLIGEMEHYLEREGALKIKRKGGVKTSSVSAVKKIPSGRFSHITNTRNLRNYRSLFKTRNHLEEELEMWGKLLEEFEEEIIIDSADLPEIERLKRPLVDEKYSYADFLWEATRRNEDYKRDYANMKHIANERFTKRVEQQFRKFMIKWGIQQMPPKDKYFLLECVKMTDPAISIDDMKNSLNLGQDLYEVHPFCNEMLRPVLSHIYVQDRDPYDDVAYRWNLSESTRKLEIDFENIRGKLVLAIDPTAADEEILKIVKKIKDDTLRTIKEDSRKKCFQREIDSYMEWFKKYDDVVSKLGKKEIRLKKGAIVPKKFGKGLISEIPDGGTFESQLKSYRTAFYEAVKFIQEAPHIPLAPSRIPRATKK